MRQYQPAAYEPVDASRHKQRQKRLSSDEEDKDSKYDSREQISHAAGQQGKPEINGSDQHNGSNGQPHAQDCSFDCWVGLLLW
jgi:hypothetical protein